MNPSHLTILFIADIIGNPGLAIIKKALKSIREKYQVDFCIANGENGAAGKGLTEDIAAEYFKHGIDLVTSGNHIFEKYGYFKFLSTNHRVLRPLNYPLGTAGAGATIVSLQSDIKIGVINIQGQTYMPPIDCPFRAVSEELIKMRKITSIIIVDFHAEATAEKIAMAWHLDGKVSALIGTHTHVQTADETILHKGTAYITDVGMTGPYDSVIGMKKEVAIKRFIQKMPERYQPADSDLRFAGVIVKTNTETGKAESIQRILTKIQ